jgi:hypothetical protein
LIFECGCCLEYAGEKLKDDFNIVHEAVKNNGFSLEHASENLRKNHKIINIATQSRPLAIKYCIL